MDYLEAAVVNDSEAYMVYTDTDVFYGGCNLDALIESYHTVVAASGCA
eukprot:CAMPEP_0168473578 /NCGR_PEP_ID=MMETSP0228-20121227/60397_1 /TAXON_ID=133427 /ORGANISM="Protoceratium reticulatum, Strain CCCM 535 (=CCMP 1889)" /LENGTH=47 /DNA_ID= /DNA_START= /DNA_END= /DNA_ORIENTATION=